MNQLQVTSGQSLFSAARPVIGMIHLAALPGTPANHLTLAEIERHALQEAHVYREAGIHALLIENMHDTPYLRGRVGPEIVASMAMISRAVRDQSQLPCGIQILAGANNDALAVALAARLSFVRVEAFAFAHVADEGILQSSAAELLRYRRAIGAGAIQIWADIKKKHSSHAITSDISIGETAHAVEFMRGDAVIVTGSVTGQAPEAAEIRQVRSHTTLPTYLGSGVNLANLKKFFPLADGFIVGSEFKESGHWSQPLDRKRIDALMKLHQKLSP